MLIMYFFINLKISLLLLIINLLNLCFSARILTVFTVPFRDQQHIFRPLINQLADRGHHLTVITTDPDFNSEYSNVNYIDLSFVHRLKILANLHNDHSDVMRHVFHVMRTVAESELKSPQMQELLRNDTENFDAVIVDWSGPSLMNSFSHRFKAPLIGITPGGAYVMSHEAIGNPNHPISYPSILMPFSENLNIFQRIASTFFTLSYRYLYLNEELPIQQQIANEYFGDSIPNLWNLEQSADMLLINNYQALGNSRPIGPKTIYLGGIHATVKKNLPYDLQKFLDNSNFGVIYINLGDMTTRAFVNSDRINKIVRILAAMNYDIIWNWNGVSVDVNSTSKFYDGSYITSQEDVLAHKNVRLFVTIGGQRDIEDAIHHSVPVFGLTFSSSLEHYLLQIFKYDAGIVSNFDLETENILMEKFEDIIKNGRYKTNINRLQKIIKDQPMSSIETAVWWIEYVIRNNGTKHLTSLKLSWFEYLLLDVFFTILIFLTILITVFLYAVIQIRRYSKSLPFEKVTRKVKAKLA